MKPVFVTRWIDALLGGDPSQRERTERALAVALVYAGLCGIGWLGAALGMVPWVPMLSITMLGAGFPILLYAAVRSGRNTRFVSDPAMVMPQVILLTLFGNAGYVIAGPVRGAMLMSLLIGQIIGMFALTPRQSRRLGGMTVASAGVTMACCAYFDPVHFVPREELLHFLLLALMVPAIIWLGGELSAIRSTLRLQKTQLEAALAQNRLLATQDELTSLSNRRHMTALMVAERARQQRNRTPISMVLMDIDHFKLVNDRCGHQAGDQVLQIFADVISHGLRAGDSLARWGGEEFLLMLPNTTADDALVCVERMRFQLASRSFEHITAGLNVTFSAGIGVCTVDDRIDAIVDRADKAMYRAKTDGRNRTVVA